MYNYTVNINTIIRKNCTPRSKGGFFIEGVEVKVKLNMKAHSWLKKIAQKRGVPMTNVIRWYVYTGIENELRTRKELLKYANEINQKTK